MAARILAAPATERERERKVFGSKVYHAQQRTQTRPPGHHSNCCVSKHTVYAAPSRALPRLVVNWMKLMESPTLQPFISLRRRSSALEDKRIFNKNLSMTLDGHSSLSVTASLRSKPANLSKLDFTAFSRPRWSLKNLFTEPVRH